MIHFSKIQPSPNFLNCFTNIFSTAKKTIAIIANIHEHNLDTIFNLIIIP